MSSSCLFPKSPDFVYEWFRPDPTAASVEDTLMNSVPCVSELETEPQVGRTPRELIVINLKRLVSHNFTLVLQGEALAIASDQSGFFTTSEGLQQPIFFYEFS